MNRTPPPISFVLLVLAIVFAGANQSLAYTEQENLAFIDSVLGLLNNNVECELPTYDQVDEMQKCFAELEQTYGEQLEWRLSDDQRLARNTVLDQWSSFQKRMTDAVVIKSAKKRSFICKIEAYQKGKFGESVCTRIKDVRGPITDKIFEKNPIVRYIKHLETGGVPERPVEDPITTTTAMTQQEQATTTQEEPSITTTTSGPEEVRTPTTTEEEIIETTSGLRPTEPITDPTQDEEVTEPITEATTANSDVDSSSNHLEIHVPGSDGEPDANGVVHYSIAKLIIDYANGPKKIVIELNSRDDDPNHDPLDDIPVPSSDDNAEDIAQNVNYPPTTTTTTTTTTERCPTTEKDITDEPEVSTTTTTTTTTSTSTTVSPYQFDEFGAEFVDEANDDADLERLVRPPPKEWAFDAIYGYFKWPDEPQPSFFKKTNQHAGQQQPPASDSSGPHPPDPTRAQWAIFINDPDAFEARFAPKMSQAALRRKKKEFMDSVAREGRFHRQSERFGWVGETTAPAKDPLVPKYDRWVKLADNNFCKMEFNRDYIPNATKRGAKAVKSFFSSSSSNNGRGDGINRKRRLLS